MLHLDQLHEIALDLTRSMVERDRYQQIVDGMRRGVPCDAAALLRAEEGELLPVAVHGLVPEVLGRRFRLVDHPRLAEICASKGPHRFPSDSELPDPFDGLIANGEPHLTAVHSCLGVPLRIEGELVGVLTADALTPDAFDEFDEAYLSFLGALAASALRTGLLLDAAERSVEFERSLTRQLLDRPSSGMLGESAALGRIRDEVALVARADMAVLVTGESGVGKEHVAREVHRASARSSGPLVVVNCAALPDSLAESELFGHERGAFTGADKSREGRFEAAEGGTLFLDEVGELPLPLQPKLLRALQAGEVQRVGSDTPKHVDVRVVAATNRDLVRDVDAGRFRADLYHRLCQFPIHVPPLRERPEDVALLAASFAESAQRQLGTGTVRITRAAHDDLAARAWPGNVRELQNVVARAVLRAAGKPGEPVLVDGDVLDPGRQAAPSATNLVSPGLSLGERVEAFKREAIREALTEAGGNLAAAARSLGVQRSNLYTTAKRLGLLG